MTNCLHEFRKAFEKLPDCWLTGRFLGRSWSATVHRSEGGRRCWLFAQERGGSDIVSFNLYLLDGEEAVLRPCEMSSEKVIDFVLAFEPTTTGTGST